MCDGVSKDVPVLIGSIEFENKGRVFGNGNISIGLEVWGCVLKNIGDPNVQVDWNRCPMVCNLNGELINIIGVIIDRSFIVLGRDKSEFAR